MILLRPKEGNTYQMSKLIEIILGIEPRLSKHVEYKTICEAMN